VADFTIVPERVALLNVDLQKCFVASSPIACPEGRAILDRVNRFAAVCREAGILVVHTRFVLRPDGSDAGVLAETAAPVRAGILDDGRESAALHPDLIIGAADLVLDKPRFGAFHGTGLESMLRARGVDTVLIAGLMTNVCCETTAREAMMRDFRVFFLSDATATADMCGVPAAELHRATLATLGFLFAEVLTMDEMIRRIRRAGQDGAHGGR
jgi:nicotinamidase-related amidase